MTREIVIEEKVIAEFERRGWYQKKVAFIGVKGSPDRWFVRKGLWVLIEFKKPGEPLGPHQVRRKRELEAHGQDVHVIDNIEDGLNLCLVMTLASDGREALLAQSWAKHA